MSSRKLLIVLLFSLSFRASADSKILKQCRLMMNEYYSAINEPMSAKSKLRKIEVGLGRGSLINKQEKMTAKEINKHNKDTIEALAEAPPSIKGDFVVGVNKADADLLVRAYVENPAVGWSKHSSYDPEGCIGFCFGRSFITHTEALRRQVYPESIRKIWAVGPQNANDAFHVTTIIRATDLGKNGWYALDPNDRIATPLTDWMARLKQTSSDGQMAFFVTNAFRFSVESSARYKESDLFGTPKNDFYNGYFKDYLLNAAKEGEVPPFK